MSASRDQSTPAPRLIDRIRGGARSAAERKVASVLVEGYPVRALGTADSIARQAAVSAPSVLRYLARIGFERLADFQAAVLDDVERQLGSPLRNLAEGDALEASDHLYHRTLLMQAEALRTAAAQAVTGEFDVIAELLADPKLSVKVLGGRFSHVLAQRLVLQLGQVRPGVSLLHLTPGFAYDALIDMGPRDLLVVFDFRRYQAETIRFAAGARQAGARICLMTDIWRSPIAEHADAVLTSPDGSTSPFGSRVVVTAQIEALISAVVARRREETRARLAGIEALRPWSRAEIAGDTAGLDAPAGTPENAPARDPAPKARPGRRGRAAIPPAGPTGSKEAP